MLPLSFSYRLLAPMLWAMIALGVVELLLGHFLIALWNLQVAIILSVLTLALIAWLVWLVRSFKDHPVIVEAKVLVRTGKVNRIEIAIANIANVRRNFPGEAVKDKSVRNLAMMNYPNVLIDLHVPMPRRRGRATRAVGLCLDDPAGFAAAIARAQTGAAD